MTDKSDSSPLGSERRGVVGEHGTTSGEISLTSDEYERVRDVALRIINGEVDSEALVALPGELESQLPATMRLLMSSKNTESVRDLEELNPYYSVFRPRVVRDRSRNER